MKNNKWLPVLWAALVAVVLIAFLSLSEQGPEYIGKSYINSSEMQHQLDDFYENIGPAVLNRLNFEEAEKQITVTKSEIEEHRNRYGTFSDQIENIQSQYDYRITEAKDAGNDQLKEALTKERDTKTADIQKNFENDEHVEAKIRAEKTSSLAQYLKEQNNYFTGSGQIPFAYEFTDIETGETYSSGDISVKSAYKRKFDSSKGYFKARSLRINSSNMSKDMSYSSGGYGEYTEEVSEFPFGNETIIENPVRTFEGEVIISRAALEEGNLSKMVSHYYKTKYGLFIIGAFGLLALILLFTKLRFNKDWVMENKFVNWYGFLKIDTKAVFLLISVIMIFPILLMNAEMYMYNMSLLNLFVWFERIVLFVILIVTIWLIVFQLIHFFNSFKDKEVLLQEVSNSYTLKFIKSFQEMFFIKSIGIQTLILLIGFFLAGIGFVAVLFAPYLLVVYIPAVVFLGLPALYMLARRSAYLNRIILSTEKMAAGRLHEEIRIEGKSPLAKHAANLNNLREGVRVSMTEQAKSERLKTELITNVSHDLRTPLTSIITYTDLLKKEDITAEERTKYVDILDKKSQRLKTLIEDLFEVSKMASGNLELNKQRVDMTQLLQQALAEHEEEISKSGLDFRVNFPDSALVAYVDGKRWWRVLDNLIVNAIKYTLPGTRVYITLRKVGDTAEFVVKNVTKYELGENTDELYERFKRADTSRHTDGSGLGLAIAQSIVDLHNGNMKIEVDGDLFKVTVVVAAV